MVSISSGNDGKAGTSYLINKGLLGYALAGRTRQWRVRIPAGMHLQAPLRIQATINASPCDAALPIAPAQAPASAR